MVGKGAAGSVPLMTLDGQVQYRPQPAAFKVTSV